MWVKLKCKTTANWGLLLWVVVDLFIEKPGENFICTVIKILGILCLHTVWVLPNSSKWLQLTTVTFLWLTLLSGQWFALKYGKIFHCPQTESK